MGREELSHTDCKVKSLDFMPRGLGIYEGI